MAKANPAEFVRQVRQEVSKVTFPTRRETMISAVLVLIIVILAALFFLVVDNSVQFIIRSILGFGA